MPDRYINPFLYLLSYLSLKSSIHLLAQRYIFYFLDAELNLKKEEDLLQNKTKRIKQNKMMIFKINNNNNNHRLLWYVCNFCFAYLYTISDIFMFVYSIIYQIKLNYLLLIDIS